MFRNIVALLFGTRSSAGERVYLDFAAATPVRPEIIVMMEPYMRNISANPSATHFEGRQARQAIESARDGVAKVLHVRSDEVFFTGGGTESNNLAIFGAVRMLTSQGAAEKDIEIITTRVEHPSILEVVAELERKGVVIKYVPVDEEGLIDLNIFKELLSPKTALISLAYANSETGVVQDVKKISRIVKEYRSDLGEVRPLIHLDASQAPLYLPCAVDSLGVDLMTLDSGKCYGPKGAGVLIKKSYVKLAAQLYGGDQESGLRPGTENTAEIVGSARSLVIAQERHEGRSAQVGEMRDLLIAELQKEIPKLQINGSAVHRIANNVNISIPGIDGEYAVVALDVNGVAASTRSACSGTTSGGSHVVTAMGGGEERALGTIRFTLGEETTEDDVRRAVTVLKTHVIMVRGKLDQIKK